jgi:hypothetical protein
MNPRHRRVLILTILLLFSLTTLSCALLGGKEGTSPTAQPPAAGKDQPPTKEETSSADEDQPPAKEETPSADEDQPPAASSGAGGLFSDPQEALDSYRTRSTMTLREGEGMLGEAMTTELAWVRDPEAQHTVMYGADDSVMMETIVIGDDTWTSMDGETWMHVTAASEEQPTGVDDMQVDMEDLMRQMQGGMVKAGTDTVDGVRCQLYDVDADYSMPFPLPEDASEEMSQFMPTAISGHVTGQICIADQRSLPQVIVRSVTTQETTLEYESRDDETMVYDQEYELYDINKRIAIEPPQGQVQEIPTPPAGLPTPAEGGEQPPVGESGETVVYAELNELDSYHLEWTVTVEVQDTAMATGYQVDWTADPLATHLTMSMGEGLPVTEYIWVADAVWMRVGGGEWMLGGEEDMEDAINQVGEVLHPEDEMVLQGQETVNGVACKHYVKETPAPYSTRLDVWVADQGNLPPVVVRGVQRLDMEAMTTIMEANVTQINAPLTIEPPQ